MVSFDSQYDLRDSGPRKTALERLCAATGEVKCVDDMIRFVIGPNESVVPDLRRRLPGRGLWITATRQALDLAIRRKCFVRGFRRDVLVAPDLVQMTERLLERGALDALAMAHKAGRTAIGFASVETALARHPIAALLHAREAAADSVRKLARARERRGNDAAIAVINEFASAQLDLALGRSNVIHAAVLAGRVGETFLARSARLHCFRTASMARLPATERHGKPASAKAARGRAPVVSPDENMQLRELDRHWNG